MFPTAAAAAASVVLVVVVVVVVVVVLVVDVDVVFVIAVVVLVFVGFFVACLLHEINLFLLFLHPLLLQFHLAHKHFISSPAFCFV